MFGKRRMLGLAVTSRSITAVEVVSANGGGRTRRAGEFAFEKGTGLEQPAALGKALRRFLRGGGFAASRCVIGIEAGWLTAREKTLPPGTGDSAGEVLALMVEREFASDREQLVFDYALGPETHRERAALLVAARRGMVEGLTSMAAAAGLSVVAITASTLALAESEGWSTAPRGAAGASTAAAPSPGASPGDDLVLHLYGDGAELAVRAEGGLRLMRRLPVVVPRPSADAPNAPTDGWVADLADQVHRVACLLPGDAGRPAARELLVWDDARPLDEEACRTLSGRTGLPVRRCGLPGGLELADAPAPAGGAVSAAAAVAVHALRGKRPSVDLLHSRLFARRKLRMGRRAIWGGVALAAVAAVAVAFGVDYHRDRAEAAALERRLNAVAGDVAEAENVVDEATFARYWHDRRPSYVAVLRALTLAFPEEGSIWANSVAVQEDMRVVFSGKAVSESAVLDVLDRLKADPAIVDVKPLYLQHAGRRGREIAFSMSFTFKPPNRTWSSPSAKRSSLRRR